MLEIFKQIYYLDSEYIEKHNIFYVFLIEFFKFFLVLKFNISINNFNGFSNRLIKMVNDNRFELLTFAV